MKAIVLAAALISALAGCSDGEKAKWNALSQKHVIEMYSGGVLVRQWESTGKVSNEDKSDGYYFEDSTTHLLVTVSGSIVITVKVPQ